METRLMGHFLKNNNTNFSLFFLIGNLDGVLPYKCLNCILKGNSFRKCIIHHPKILGVKLIAMSPGTKEFRTKRSGTQRLST
jgi:hypothetical protein